MVLSNTTHDAGQNELVYLEILLKTQPKRMNSFLTDWHPNLADTVIFSCACIIFIVKQFLRAMYIFNIVRQHRILACEGSIRQRLTASGAEILQIHTVTKVWSRSIFLIWISGAPRCSQSKHNGLIEYHIRRKPRKNQPNLINSFSMIETPFVPT